MDRKAVLFLLLAAVLCGLMPSRQSLWIDEAQTYAYAAQPSYAAWQARLLGDQLSETLMPLGMFAAWLGGKTMGLGEWQLRAPNALWMMLAAAAFAWLGRRWQTPWAPLVFAVQPFVWFYADEARPYALQIAASAVMVAALVTILENRRVSSGALAVLVVASGALVAVSLFGVVTAGPAVALLAVLVWRERWPLPPRARGWLVAGGLWWVACGIYYLSALARGGKGAKLWSVGWPNLAFAGYEFLGFTGYGPSREELRELARAGGLAQFGAQVLPMALLALVYAGVFFILVRHWRRSGEGLAGPVLAAVLGAAFLGTVTLALGAGFPFWGRHLAPAFPVFCALLILGLRRLLAVRPGGVGIAGLALLLALLGTSSLLLRRDPRHAKDDYRAAAQCAREALARGQVVWWLADPQAARYYGVAIAANEVRPGSATILVPPSAPTVAALPRPGVVITSKPDIFDDRGAVDEFLRTQGFRPVQRFKAFTVWQPPAP